MGTFAIVVFAFAILMVFMSVKAVPQGFEYIVERFGRYTNTLTPGLNIIVPIINRIGHLCKPLKSTNSNPPVHI